MPELHDSLIVSSETVYYEEPRQEHQKEFKSKKISAIKYSSSNNSIKEIYSFDDGVVKLLGYTTGDTLNPLIAFSTPLTILPELDQIESVIETYQQTWNNQTQRFEDDTKVHTRVQLLRNGKLVSEDGKEEKIYLFELTFGGDSRISYGDRELVIPNAFLLKSKLLYGRTKGLLYEWSIKTDSQHGNNSTELNQNQVKQYIELIHYTK